MNKSTIIISLLTLVAVAKPCCAYDQIETASVNLNPLSVPTLQAKINLKPEDISLGKWRWANGVQLNVSGDRIKVMYGEKMNINLSLQPLKNEGTISLSISSNF